MRKGIYKLLLAFAALLINVAAFAQYQTDTTKVITPATADGIMRSHNKIYVVMAVCLTILSALILYLIYIDRKVTKLEQLNK